MYIHNTACAYVFICYPESVLQNAFHLTDSKLFPVLILYIKAIQFNNCKHFKGKSPVLHFLYVSSVLSRVLDMQ